MIVVDTNIITYLFLEGENTKKAEAAFKKDSEWIAPILWKSEFRNVLSFYIRQRKISLDHAIQIMDKAEQLMIENEYDVVSEDVLNLTRSSDCSAYDCEFVSLAKDLGIPLITLDKKVFQSFPQFSISLNKYIL